MIILLILSIIPLIYALLVPITNLYIFLALFTLDFIVIGLTSTKILYPLEDMVKITRKPIQVITLAIFVSLIGVLITRHIRLSTNNFIIILSIISIILTVIASTNKLNVNYSNNKLVKKVMHDNIPESTFAIATYCLISFIGINVPPFSVIPLWFGLCIPFIFFLTGYLTINTIIPKKEEIQLPERIGIAVFISLVLMSIIGFIYAQVNHSLNMRIVTLVILFITLLILIPSYTLRIRKLDKNIIFNNPTIEKILIIMTIVSLILVILSGIYINAESLTTPAGNTTFNIEGITQTANEDGYYKFNDGDTIDLNISLSNQENEDVDYKITVESVSDNSTKEVSNFTKTLKDGESTKIPTNITLSQGKKDVLFTLYKNETQAYKIRHLYVNVE